jgi:hypothetical protein
MESFFLNILGVEERGRVVVYFCPANHCKHSERGFERRCR